MRLVVFEHVDAECVADGRQEMILVHLGVALDGFMLYAGRDLPQLGHFLVLEIIVCVFHGQKLLSPAEKPDRAGVS